ncbi:MAG: hypothetical protein IMF08_00130 [Proteobacteria bacterium]|nr:hypothetical protein [Pseudomonadota bacterium]
MIENLDDAGGLVLDTAKGRRVLPLEPRLLSQNPAENNSEEHSSSIKQFQGHKSVASLQQYPNNRISECVFVLHIGFGGGVMGPSKSSSWHIGLLP